MLLFFDTETTGVPRRYDAPISDLANWPRLVQIGWVLYNDDGTQLDEAEYIIKPEGFVIPESVVRIHGITTESASLEGTPLREVLSKFSDELAHASIVVGHNVSYDVNVVGAEYLRCGMEDALAAKPKICTMRESTNFCKLPGPLGYKWPKLQELYGILFHTDMGAAHNALVDIKATAASFFELKRLGVVNH